MSTAVSEKSNATNLRPTVVVALYRRKGNGKLRILIILSAKGREKGETIWLLPQGGIKNQETVVDAAYREIDEELGIKNDKLEIYDEILVQGEVVGRPGRPKEYFVLAADYRGPTRLRLKKDEVAKARWVSPKEASRLISQTNNPKKTYLLQTGIEKAKELVSV